VSETRIRLQLRQSNCCQLSAMHTQHPRSIQQCVSIESMHAVIEVACESRHSTLTIMPFEFTGRES
jgi:hypothetical protein